MRVLFNGVFVRVAARGQRTVQEGMQAAATLPLAAIHLVSRSTMFCCSRAGGLLPIMSCWYRLVGPDWIHIRLRRILQSDVYLSRLLQYAAVCCGLFGAVHDAECAGFAK
eukprot:GHRQ01039942.1.p2 GENE.GHRQ01039942.1~~GHRQ01039942.1.p2  ORF type:complete len:110 (-),score=14.95 GHRQ01039942.1:102-431(-)